MAIKTRGGICPDGDTIINQESSLAGGGDRDGMYLVTKRGLAIECKCEGLLPISLTPTYAHFAYRSNSIELSVSPGVTVTVHVGCSFCGPALPRIGPPAVIAVYNRCYDRVRGRHKLGRMATPQQNHHGRS